MLLIMVLGQVVVVVKVTTVDLSDDGAEIKLGKAVHSVITHHQNSLHASSIMHHPSSIIHHPSFQLAFIIEREREREREREAVFNHVSLIQQSIFNQSIELDDWNNQSPLKC